MTTILSSKAYVEAMIKRAAEANDSADAMRYSQAALNAANARSGLADADRSKIGTMSTRYIWGIVQIAGRSSLCILESRGGSFYLDEKQFNSSEVSIAGMVYEPLDVSPDVRR